MRVSKAYSLKDAILTAESDENEEQTHLHSFNCRYDPTTSLSISQANQPSLKHHQASGPTPHSPPSTTGPRPTPQSSPAPHPSTSDTSQQHPSSAAPQRRTDPLRSTPAAWVSDSPPRGASLSPSLRLSRSSRPASSAEGSACGLSARRLRRTRCGLASLRLRRRGAGRVRGRFL